MSLLNEDSPSLAWILTDARWICATFWNISLIPLAASQMMSPMDTSSIKIWCKFFECVQGCCCLGLVNGFMMFVAKEDQEAHDFRNFFTTVAYDSDLYFVDNKLVRSSTFCFPEQIGCARNRSTLSCRAPKVFRWRWRLGSMRGSALRMEKVIRWGFRGKNWRHFIFWI